MMFCPPGLFSMTMVWPQLREMRSATRRATLSTPEPAGWARMSLTGRSGHVSALTMPLHEAATEAMASLNWRRCMSECSCEGRGRRGEAIGELVQLLHQGGGRGGDGVDVVIRPHDRGAAFLAAKPAREDAVGFPKCRVVVADFHRSRSQLPFDDGRHGPRHPGVVGHNAPARSGQSIEPYERPALHDPGLREQRAGHNMTCIDIDTIGSEQSALQARLHVLARLGANDASALGKQRRIAGASAHWVAFADHRADAFDARGELLHMALALRAIAVEQRVTGA